ncbi:c-type cytochrome [Azospirillum sp. ST 5-10]|uniref:c-type cytochrome n=1 Tax=unclassified Azospirillum TaxID=2630922 RepID=UPI003F49E51A
MRPNMPATALLLVVAAVADARSASAQDAATEGAREFRARCGTCHSTDVGRNRIGPTLSGVFGRAAGSVEGARYSAALEESAIVWDERTLDDYLADPRRTVPGTSMTVAVPDQRRRALLIAYLRRLSGQPG